MTKQYCEYTLTNAFFMSNSNYCPIDKTRDQDHSSSVQNLYGVRVKGREEEGENE